MAHNSIYCSYLDSPLGLVLVLASESGIISISFENERKLDHDPNTHSTSGEEQLRAYFEKTRREFDLVLDYQRYSSFFRSVWAEVTQIPYGQTQSYKQIAQKVDFPDAVRAVGMANGKNPFPIVIPCHRVIGSNGDLTGYAYGLDMKRKLLMHENPENFGMQQSMFVY